MPFFFGSPVEFYLLDYSFILIFPIDDVMTDPFFSGNSRSKNKQQQLVSCNKQPLQLCWRPALKRSFLRTFKGVKKGEGGAPYILPKTSGEPSIWIDGKQQLEQLERTLQLMGIPEISKTEWTNHIISKYPPVNSHGNGESLFTPGNTSSNGPFPIAMFICRSVMFQTYNYPLTQPFRPMK